MRGHIPSQKRLKPKKKVASEWCSHSSHKAEKETAEILARPKVDRPRAFTNLGPVRCPGCGRRLMLWAHWHDGGEHGALEHLQFPKHKTKVARER
jgi:hypothetical protein